MVMAASESNSKRRVKLYMLNDERLWDDRGTGHVTSVYNGRLQGMVLIVRAETDGTLLLESKINLDTAYQKQQETLIVWSEADNYDLALSFQEKIGCDEIWEKICQVQGKDPSVHLTQDVVEESEDERFDELPDTAPPIELPPCELSKLLKISELFNSVLQSPVQKEKLSIPLESDGYIKKLLELFHMCEDLENMEGLHHLYDIFKAIFLLNKNALFEIMFADDTIFDVVGVLEYDPSLPQPARHREFLRTKASFKEVIPLSNTELVQKIHQTYRVQYIQDVILPTPSVFEENILSTLSSFIFFNKVEIVTLLQDDEAFLLSLFKQLVDEDTEDERRRDLVLFLKEFCTFSQTLQVPNRDPFFKVLSNMGVLSAIEALLQFDDDVIKAAAIDVLSYIVEYSPSMVREYIKQESQKQDDEELLINLVIDQMISDNDPELGGSVQLMGILRLLIDPDNMIPTANFALQKTEKTDFLVFFYKHSMHTLTARLFAVTATDKLSKDDYRTAHLLSLIIELLTFCIEHHNYHIKNYVINKDLIRRVLVLLKSKHAFLALSAIRLFRRTVGLKEEFYNKYLVKGSLFQPIVDCFIRNGIKYNLLNSAIIELFEFIKTEDIRSLILHIVENHATAFEDVTYVNTFKELTKRFEQHQERIKERPLDGSMSLLRDARYRRDPRSMEEEEEMYFDQDDELDDETVTADLLTRSHTRLEPFNFIEASRERYSIDEDIEDAPRRLPPRQGISININKNLAEVNGNSPPPNGGQAPATSPVTDSPTSKPDADTPHTSPTTNHVSPTPTTTPFSSPTISASGGATLDTPPTDDQSQKKVPFVGLVDYPDEDSEEEESDDGGVSPTKRARVSST